MTTPTLLASLLLVACTAEPVPIDTDETPAPTETEEVVRCEYHGQTYEPGDSFSSIDGCNHCECEDDGSVGCTDMACYDREGPCGGLDDVALEQGVRGAACEYNFEHGDGWPLAEVSIFPPTGPGERTTTGEGGSYGFEVEPGGYVLCDPRTWQCVQAVVAEGAATCDLLISDTPDEFATEWQGCGPIPDWPVFAWGVSGAFAYDAETGAVTGALVDGEEVRPWVEVRLYLDAWVESRDPADTCAVRLDLLGDAPTATLAAADGLEHAGLATVGQEVTVSHDCGTETWVDQAVALITGQDWAVGFGDLGPDIDLDAEEAAVWFGGSAHWSRLAERGLPASAWNTTRMWSTEREEGRVTLALDEEGAPIGLPSDQAGESGWYEVEPYWLNWVTHLW